MFDGIRQNWRVFITSEPGRRFEERYRHGLPCLRRRWLAPRALFWASILLASAALLFSGVPAALYARLVERNAESTASMWIWLAGAAALILPVALRAL